jgi:S-DNA-T family DNA segregation ATPase FtsK/SpoIIIE
MRKKKEAGLEELFGSLGYLYRHRAGIKLFGKSLDQLKLGKGKTIYLDNQIPALVQDVFQNKDYEQKDGQKPVIAAKRKTEYGWHLIINLPPGVSFNQVKNDKDFFQDACNAWVELEWKSGKVHMNIQLGELPSLVKYEWDTSQHSNMILPIPIGYSRTGLHVLDLTESPHLLIAGTTGFGKTSLVASIIHSVIHRAIVVIIDLKGIDFEYLRDHCIVAITNEEAHQILMALNIEFEKRRDLIRKYKVRKLIHVPDPSPYIVLVVDELAELDKDNFELVDRLVRLARATSISVVAASQRTSTKVISGDTRANFVARCCFKVPSAADSRVVLGEDCNAAGDLPSIKGRCIYRFGIDTMELQAMYLSEKHAEELALNTKPQRGWEVNVHKPEPKTKRLSARQ